MVLTCIRFHCIASLLQLIPFFITTTSMKKFCIQMYVGIHTSIKQIFLYVEIQISSTYLSFNEYPRKSISPEVNNLVFCLILSCQITTDKGYFQRSFSVAQDLKSVFEKIRVGSNIYLFAYHTVIVTKGLIDIIYHDTRRKCNYDLMKAYQTCDKTI